MSEKTDTEYAAVHCKVADADCGNLLCVITLLVCFEKSHRGDCIYIRIHCVDILHRNKDIDRQIIDILVSFVCMFLS